jgi:hypothetical protein
MSASDLIPMPSFLKAKALNISDDDLCATCTKCTYKPGELSFCSVQWPCKMDPDGYVKECEQLTEAV